MSGVPPGYNPSDSLLTGGTTPINAVMGGGGSDSLLTGGESAVIQGVQGGGKAKRALSYRRKRRVQKGGVLDINKNLYNGRDYGVMINQQEKEGVMLMLAIIICY